MSHPVRPPTAAQPPPPPPPPPSRRAALATLLASVPALAAASRPPLATAAAAASGGTAGGATAATAAASAAPPTVAAAGGAAVPTAYFGSGCFWGRQHDFVVAEQRMGRGPGAVTAVVGYAGGRAGTDDKGRVCYYYANDASVYERRGHAEVVSVALAPKDGAGDPAAAEAAFREFARVFFAQFVATPLGMMRQDPQDAGPGYRNVVGVPGGVKGRLFKILEEENVHGMTLVPGTGGGTDERGRPTEPDAVNTVYVLDSDALPFYPAEAWHQYHDGLGYRFPAAYKRDAKRAATAVGAVPGPGETGCPEFPFL